MKHVPVKSSNIESVAYDADSKVMEVKFRGGGTYSYSGVPKDTYDNLIGAGDSVGRNFHVLIKGRYVHKKL